MAFWVRDRGYYRSLVALAIPIILQSVLTQGVSVADNMMVGRLGEDAISGLYIGNRVQMVLQILLMGLDSSLIILAAQYWGRRDCGHIRDLVSIAMRLSVAFSALVTALAVCCPRQVIGFFTEAEGVIEAGASYLRLVGWSYVPFCVSLTLITAMRSVEMVRIGLINSVVALMMNVTGNWLLIYGHCGFPALGIRGAAVATLVSRLAELAVVLYFVLRVDRHLRLRLSDFRRWDADIWHDLLTYGSPLMGGQVVWAINQFARTYVVGSLEVSATAAISIADIFDGLLCLGVFGLASAVGVMTGKTIGRNEFETVKTQARTMQVIFAGIGVMVGTFCYACRGLFLSFYALSPETLAVADTVLVVLSVTTAFRCYQGPCFMGLVKAGGDTSFVFKNDTVFVFGAVIPSALVARYVLGAPAWVVYACLLCDQVLKCLVAVVKINSFNWMRNLTREARVEPSRGAMTKR